MGQTAGVLALWLLPRPALAETPMSYLESLGPRGQAIADLTWALLALSVAVVLIIALLVLFGTVRPRSIGPGEVGRRLPVVWGAGGVRWICIGLAPTIIALIGSITWTVVTLAAIDQPPAEPRFTIEITGQQWWWEVRYISDDPSRIFKTANEIHVPVGEPVRLKLGSAGMAAQRGPSGPRNSRWTVPRNRPAVMTMPSSAIAAAIG